MAAKILWRTLELEPLYRFVLLFGLKERPYPGRELKSFWPVILILKTLIFLRFSILADISVLLILAIIKI